MLLLTFLLLHTRAVQSFIGRQASQALSERLGTRVSVGNVDLGFFNRIVIDDIVIDDQQGRQMLKAGRVAAKVDLLPLAKGKITISSAQLFGLKADLYQADADSKTNFQFVIDSLSSKDRQEHKPLDLQVKSLIIRNGELTWNRLDKPRTTATINPAHLAVSNITAHLVLDQLTDDRLNLNIKRLSMKERSGLDIRKLTAKIVADKQKASVRNFTIELPATTLTSDRLTVKFGQKFDDKGIDMQHIQYDGTLQASAITPSDFTWIAPHADKLKETFNLVSSFSGTSSSLLVDNLKLNTKSNNISLNLSGSCQKRIDAPQWFAKIQRLHINDEGATHLLQALENTIPAKATDILRNIHHIDFTGEGYSRAEHMAVNGTLSTGIGDAKLAISKRFDALSADVATESIHLGKLLGDDTFGMVAADISLKTTLGHTLNDAAIKASAPRFDYRGYTYRNISVDGKALLDASYSPVAFNGKAALDDANGNINFDGNIDLRSSSPQLKGNLQVSNLNPAILGLTDKWAGNRLDFTADADMKGLDLNNAIGTLDIHDFRRSTDTGHYALDRLSITQSGTGAGARHLSVVGDFGELHADGHYNYTSLQHSLVNLICPPVKGFDNHAIVAIRVDVCHLESEVSIAHQALKVIEAVVGGICVQGVDEGHNLIILISTRLDSFHCFPELLNLLFQVCGAVCQLTRLQVGHAVAAAYYIVPGFNLVYFRLPFLCLRQVVDSMPCPGVVRSRAEADKIILVNRHVCTPFCQKCRIQYPFS